MTLTFLRAQPEDAFELELRAEDRDEVSFGWREAVAQAIKTGCAWSFRDSAGQLVGIAGITRPDDRSFSPWMLCSELAQLHGKALMRRCKQQTESLQIRARCGAVVFNHIPKYSTGNRRFVERMGFVIIPTPGDGPDLFILPCASQY